MPGAGPIPAGDTDAHATDAAAVANDFANQRVPLTYRMSARSLAGAWWAFASAMFWLIFAALVAETVGTKDALIGMGLSVIAYGLINWLLSIYSARTGTTVNIFSTALFGKVGGVLAPLLLAVTAIWFATLEGSVIAVAFKQFFGFWDIRIWYLVVVLYSVPLVIGSVRTFLDKFNRYLLPFYILGLAVAVIWTIAEYGYSNDWLRHQGAVRTAGGPGWIWAFTAFMGDWVLMMATWDYARFGRPERRQERINGVYSFGPVFYFFTIIVNGLVGIFLSFTIPTDGPLNEASAVVGIVSLMGFWGLLLVWISQTRINTANFYLAATNLQNSATGVWGRATSRRIWVVVVGVVVYLVMLSNVLTFIVQALAYQALFTVTWTAVVVVRIGWGLVRDRRADDVVVAGPNTPVPGVRWFGVIGWLSGAAAGCLMLALGGQASAAWTWALPSALAISCVVYGALLEWTYRRSVAATDLVIPA